MEEDPSDEDNIPFAVMGEAYLRSNLPKHEAKGGVLNPLGMEPEDWFTHNILAVAGISVELIKKTGDGDLTLVQHGADHGEA